PDAFPIYLPYVALGEAQLDPRAHERVGLAGVTGRRASPPLDARLPDQHAEPRRLVEQRRIGAGRKVAAVDGDLAAGPHAVVAFEAQPIGDDDVALVGRRVTGLVLPVFDGGTLRGVAP